MLIFLATLVFSVAYAVRYGVFLLRADRKGAAIGAFLLAAPLLGLADVLTVSFFR